MSEELKRFIRTGGEQARKQSQKALDELGIMGESKGKELLTPSVVYNRLRSSWHWENHKTKTFIYRNKDGESFNGVFRERPGKQEVVVGSNVKYAWGANKYSRSKGYVERVRSYLNIQFDWIMMKHLRKIN